MAITTGVESRQAFHRFFHIAERYRFRLGSWLPDKSVPIPTNSAADPLLIDRIASFKDIRTGFGPENMTRLRRFAVGILTSFQKPAHTIAEMMRTLCFRTRLVFDYLRMTNNSVTGSHRR